MKYLFVIVLLFTCAFSRAQVNFVLNPDFELYTQCPTGPDNINDCTYWSAVDSSGQNTCIPEFCHPCATGSGLTTPLSSRFYQQAHSGTAFAHGYIYYNGPTSGQGWYRDYLQGRLYDTLIPGKNYCVRFFVCAAEHSGFGIDKIGAYLDDGSIDTVSYCGIPLTQYIPQIENTSGVIDDTMHWTKIEGSFTATGTETFVTIGNFYDFANTATVTIPPNSFSGGLVDWAYYLFDDVSVIESDLEACAGPDTWVVEGDSVFIGRTPEVGLDCKWLVNGNVIDSGAGIWAKPTISTTYIVEQTICGLTKTDTVKVEVWPVSINGVTNGQQVSIYPNPARNELLVKQEKYVFTQAIIYNQLGQQVSMHPLNDKEMKLDITDLSVGVYQISLEGEKGKDVRRFIKM